VVSSDSRPPEYNPYSGPAHDARSTAAEGIPRVPGENLRWAYAGLSALNAALFLALRFPLTFGIDGARQATLVTLVDNYLRWGFVVIALSWLYAAWSGIPHAAQQRQDVTAGNAVAKLFIPFYNLYWIFAVNLRLCNAIDGLLIENGDERRTPAGLSVLAIIVYYVPTLMLLSSFKEYAFVAAIADNVLWTVYLFQMDELRRAAVGIRRHV
jgi:hypothetical protein